MANIIAQLDVLTKTPPVDPIERLNLYNAAKKLVIATEDPSNTICRVIGSVSCLGDRIICLCYFKLCRRIH